VAFLASRGDERVPVANRYFGGFQDGSIKVRGIEARRRDTAPFVAQTQMALLEHLAQGADADAAKARLPGALNLLRMALQRLRRNEVPLEDLITGQKLSKALEDYTSPSPAARAAAQLASVGKQARPGQRVRLIYMLGEPGVHAWDLPDPPDRAGVDLARYRVLLLRAAGAIFQPFGMSEQALLAWAVERRDPPRQLRLPGGENLRRPAIHP
jgi:DNA polymerase-2